MANFGVLVAREIVEGKTFISKSAEVNICWVAHVFLRISSDTLTCIVKLRLDLGSNF